jgi:hypothetical protein
MRNMRKIIAIAATLGVLLGVAFVGTATAGAEECSPNGKICLVDLGPYMPPQEVRYKVPTEAVEYGADWCDSSGCVPGQQTHLVTQGPPGGLSTYADTFTWPVDAQVNVHVGYLLANNSGGSWDFGPETVIAPAVGFQSAVTKKAVGTYSFSQRRSVTAIVQLRLYGSNNPGKSWGKRLMVKSLTQIGSPVTAKLKYRKAKRKCRNYKRCTLRFHVEAYVTGYFGNSLDFNDVEKKLKR